jgi:hypothetical protein
MRKTSRAYKLSLALTVALFSASFVSSVVLPYQPLYVTSLFALGGTFLATVALAIFANPFVATIWRSALTLVGGLISFSFFYTAAMLASDPFVYASRDTPLLEAELLAYAVEDALYWLAAIMSLHLFLAAFFSLLGRGAIKVFAKIGGRR